MAKIRWQATIQDSSGDIQSGAQVTINNAGSTAATIYADRDGLSTLGNPLASDSDGYVFGYLDAGRYDITASLGVFSITWPDVEVVDSAAGGISSGDTVPVLTITDLNIVEVTETVYSMITVAVDSSNGTWQKRVMTGNETFTFTIGAGQSVFLTVIPGANTLTLSNVTEWVGGAAPTTIEAEHAFVFWSDDGTTITGQSVGGIA